MTKRKLAVLDDSNHIDPHVTTLFNFGALDASGCYELALALPSSSVTSVDLSGATISSEACAFLLDRNLATLHRLDLHNTCIMAEAFEPLSGRGSRSLTYLNVSNNSLCSKGIMHLSNMLTASHSVKALGLANTFADNYSIGYILPLLSPCLTSLNLSGNRVTDAGCVMLARAGQHLEHLYLAMNLIKNQGCIALASMIGNANTRLVTLTLDGNLITDWSPLERAMATNNTLRIVSGTTSAILKWAKLNYKRFSHGQNVLSKLAVIVNFIRANRGHALQDMGLQSVLTRPIAQFICTDLHIFESKQRRLIELSYFHALVNL